jgi:hypothetical protein
MQSMPVSLPDASATLTKALLRVSEAFALNQREVAAILGLSGATMSRLYAGRSMLEPQSKEGQLALLLVRVYRSLYALVGGDEKAMRAWLAANNVHLNGVPLDILPSITGLVHVAEYLDAMRGRL